MIAVLSNQVVFSHPNIVKYFTKYYKSGTFLTSAEGLLETFCKNTDDFVLQYSNEQKYDLQTNTIMLQLEALEKQNHEFKSSINTIADDILSKVSSQLTSLILSIDNIISASVSNFNTDSLKEFIRDSFQDTSAKSKLQLEEHIKTHILAPVHDSQQKLLEHFSKLPELLSQTSNLDLFEQKLQLMNSKWQANVDAMVVDIKQIDANIESYIKFSSDSLHNSPLVIKGVLSELVHKLEQQTSNISYIVNSIQKDITCNTTNLALIKSSNDDLKSKVDSLDKQLLAKLTKESNSNSYKGSVAEETLFNLLCEKLMTRNGFSISKVNGVSHSCDILVQRHDFPDIRIESKAHGQHTGEKVRTKEIEKFERDLLELDNHGVFVSIYSDITGKGAIEITQLPNAKFAIYLSKNMYDCEIISDMVYLLYKLDDIITTSSANSNITLSPENILKIQNTIKTFNIKLNSVKSSLKDSISLLNSISLEQIEMILLNQVKENVTPTSEHHCDNCGFTSKTSSGLASHRRKCSKKKALDVSAEACIATAHDSSQISKFFTKTC